uniref:Uncharacterized protein n=1 Tax=Micrurus paraensis TaxID=1970185 RepID=A0A2D4KHR5_9SAUR
MVWMDSEVAKDIEKIEILLNLWAHHNILIVKRKGRKKRGRWTLNQTLLRDKNYIQILEKVLLFLKDNANDQTILQNLWDTTKAYTQGLTIAYGAKKEQR